MSFDMYSGNLHDAIHPHEEYLLAIAANAPKKYPELTALRDRFYDDPRISVEQCDALLHELIDLLSDHVNKNDIISVNLISRLLSFFSLARRSDRAIVCKSD
ncbi:MAG TPA: hypothetical protein IGS53_11620 [Leptolyngbyaceae cyanobacterium M33_DOE_097]|uniref:Uncharacterized protein n=1 Tax=Oscillatoriales cyanobacterium SpSt-418 TaxID=2282169 RepID=A0A7C3PJ89_9CYAN|nr:hypothetical protein [Leptolyngbyaceae cyanobacterium M33_DOE_097]